MGGFPRPKRGGKSGARVGATVRETVQLYDYQSTSMNRLEHASCAGSAHCLHRMRSTNQYLRKNREPMRRRNHNYTIGQVVSRYTTGISINNNSCLASLHEAQFRPIIAHVLSPCLSFIGKLVDAFNGHVSQSSINVQI
jgi:hypothetical protein